MIQLISVTETLPLRSHLLRNGAPLTQCGFPEDTTRESFHLGAYEDGDIIGIASFYNDPLPDTAGIGWRLRGMAVAGKFQSKGVGGALLQAGIDRLTADKKPDYLWCNARVPALRFYLRHGFEILSDEFYIPEAGPHRRMWKRFSPAP